MEALLVSGRVTVPAFAMTMKSVRASGPGGQNVNKTATKVELRVDLAAIEGMTPSQRARLRARVRGHVDEDGRLIVVSQRTRSREQNLDDALSKVHALVSEALPEPRRRIPTKPGRGARARRVEDKRKLSEKKERRRTKEY